MKFDTREIMFMRDAVRKEILGIRAYHASKNAYDYKKISQKEFEKELQNDPNFKYAVALFDKLGGFEVDIEKGE